MAKDQIGISSDPEKRKEDFLQEKPGQHVVEGAAGEPGETKAEMFGKEGEIATETTQGVPELGGLDVGKMGENVVRMAEAQKAHTEALKGEKGEPGEPAPEPSPLAEDTSVIDEAPEWTAGTKAPAAAAGAAEEATAATEAGGFMSGAGKLAGKAGPWIAGAIGAAGAIEAATRLDPKGVVSSLGAAGGAVGGAIAGAALGTAVAPGIGTVAGALIGAVGGGELGKHAGDFIPETKAGVQSDPGGLQTMMAGGQAPEMSPNEVMQLFRSMDRRLSSLQNDGIHIRDGGARTGNKV